MEQNRLHSSEECQKYDDEVFKIFYDEVKIRKPETEIVKGEGASRFDARVNNHYVELKQRNINAFDYKTYFINKDKVDHLNSIRKEGEKVILVFLFKDKWCWIDATGKTFPFVNRYVFNPRFGKEYEWTYSIDREKVNMSFYEYKTRTTPIKINVN